MKMGPDTPQAAMEHLDEIAALARDRKLAVFLDFDGTLAPIVDRPELAGIDPPTRNAVERLARLCTVAVVSGRDVDDVRKRAGIKGIYYVGSHGFDIVGPGGLHQQHAKGVEALPALDAAERELRSAVAGIDGALVERKRFSIATHYRLVAESDWPAVENAVDQALRRHPGLRKGHGKKVFELQPDIDWDKGAAVDWLLQKLELDTPDVLPTYIGDDVTDEDALRALAGRGLGIVVLDEPRPTAARYRLRDPDQVRAFLGSLADACERRS